MCAESFMNRSCFDFGACVCFHFVGFCSLLAVSKDCFERGRYCLGVRACITG